MDKTLIDAFVEQVTLERLNQATYNNLSIVLESQGWRGMAHWMRHEAKGEGGHAKKFIEYLKSQNVFQPLSALPAPETANGDPPAIFTAALDLEKKITEAIHILYFLAESQEDPAAKVFLHWFIDEQRKAEADLTDIINDLTHAQGHYTVWTLIDRELEKASK